MVTCSIGNGGGVFHTLHIRSALAAPSGLCDRSTHTRKSPIPRGGGGAVNK